MTIVHRDGMAHKNADGLSRWALPNNANNPAANEEEVRREFPIMAVSVSNLETELWDEVGVTPQTRTRKLWCQS